MSEMVERVARALCRQYELDDGFSEEQIDRAAQSEMWRNFRKASIAAIKALREPTKAMIFAAIEADGNNTPIWQAMIDAALEEKATA